ncbi:response regulator transcription factor [Massilia sp. MB5]|uniref:response regulator transcription factor n=1 Tax=unclassified Massilia TaxID=2609279 RepID=UPI00067D455F|nr:MULTISPECIES: response regulator transcription factor [unclassified Massilia]AKU23311.1 chemotaxis protein CheY [Massilia sp. NR 4-1]UMR31770.1 response regulator transcription factor [Massilia sp. MB5]
MKPKLLILDDNEVFAATLARSLGRRGLDVTVAHSGEAAMQAAAQTAFDYATIDLHLASDSGLQWIAPLRQALPQARLLVLTGYASIATTVHAIKLGADDYLAKPANVDSILSALQFQAEDSAPLPEPQQLIPMTVERLEWEHIQRILIENQGNISSTARALNMHRRTLQRKLGKKPVAK